MNVFLKNIPEGSRRGEILEFISPVIKRGLFSAKGEIKSLKLLTLKDKQAEVSVPEYHAVLDIEPDSVALRVIRKLDWKSFKDEKITVRQCFLRDYQKNRRSVPEGKAAAFIGLRTLPDRRRDLQVIALEYSAADDDPVVVTIS